jgi:hypothetical protein
MKIVKAKLVKRITEDKLMEVSLTIPDGKEFLVDLDVKMKMSFKNTEHNIIHEKEMVKDVRSGFLPVELLEFGEEVKLSDFIQESMWERILDNMKSSDMNRA